MCRVVSLTNPRIFSEKVVPIFEAAKINIGLRHAIPYPLPSSKYRDDFGARLAGVGIKFGFSSGSLVVPPSFVGRRFLRGHVSCLVQKVESGAYLVVTVGLAASVSQRLAPPSHLLTVRLSFETTRK